MFVVSFEQIPHFALLFFGVFFDFGHGKEMNTGIVGYTSGVTFSQGILNIFVIKSCFRKCKIVTKKDSFCRIFFVSLTETYSIFRRNPELVNKCIFKVNNRKSKKILEYVQSY